MSSPPPEQPTAEETVELNIAETSEARHIGRYKLIRKIGAGGMGEIHLGEDERLHRKVALKLLPADFTQDADRVRRFELEAMAASALNHPNIITIYEIGEAKGAHYIATEYIQGQTLRQQMGERLTIEMALEVSIQIASALKAAHEVGIVHRDIKPENVMLRPDGLVKVLDFGIAKLVEKPSAPQSPAVVDNQETVAVAADDANLDPLITKSAEALNETATGIIMGTVTYMSPEQLRGQKVDARADIFSLGVVLYEVIAGTSPFAGQTQADRIAAILGREPAPLADGRPDAPRELQRIVSKALCKDRDARYQLVEDLLGDLKELKQDLEFQEKLEQSSQPGGGNQSTAVRSSEGQVLLQGALRKKALGMPALAGLAALLIVAASFSYWFLAGRSARHPAMASGPPIKVGILHSRSGTMAIDERPVIDATLFAIEEINAAGGLLGRPVEAIIEDGQSDAQTFAERAEKLIAQDKVSTIFGCWTSASRKAVKEVVEKHNHLLLYPVQNEGLEQSANIVYLGAAPNQQIIPAVKWCTSFLKKKRLFLVGSDYIFPRAANAIIRDQVKGLGVEIVGEEYRPLGSSNTTQIVERIRNSKAEIILNTINGDTNVAFFRALRAAGIFPSDIPTISFSTSEDSFSSLRPQDMAGDYAVWNYFQGIDNVQNKSFVSRFQQRFGSDRSISDPMEAAYAGVLMWAKAVQGSGSDDATVIRRELAGQILDAPEGRILIDPATMRTCKFVRIARITKEGHFEVIYSSDVAIAPIPYPETRSREAWDAYLADLQRGWGGQWANPNRIESGR